MAIKYRQELGRPLTYAEGDENFRTLEDSIEKTLAEYPTLTAAMADDIPDGVVFIVNDGDDAGYWRRDSSLPEGAEFLREFPATEQQIADIGQRVDDLHNQVDVELAGIRSDNASFQSDVNQDLQQITAEKQVFESEAQDIKDALANMTTTGKIYDSLADAIAENPKPADGTPFSVMGDGDNDGYYKFDSTQPDGIKFGRKFDRRIQVESISQLRNYIGRPGEAVDVLGYYENGDGGGGTFYWDATSEEEDNGGTTIKVTGVEQGRWKRRLSGEVNFKHFGAKGDGVTDESEIVQRVFDFAADNNITVKGDSGKTYIIDDIIVENKNRFTVDCECVFKRQDNLPPYPDGNETRSLTFINCEDILVVNLFFDGNAANNNCLVGGTYNWGGYKQEQRHSLYIDNCQDLVFENLNFKNPSGDGMYATGGDTQNIHIKNIAGSSLYSDGSIYPVGRNLLSIVEGKKYTVDNISSNGIGHETMPGGLDIEPNNGQQVDTVNVTNYYNRCYASSGLGIVTKYGDGQNIKNVWIGNSHIENERLDGPTPRLVVIAGATNVWIGNIYVKGSSRAYNFYIGLAGNSIPVYNLNIRNAVMETSYYGFVADNLYGGSIKANAIDNYENMYRLYNVRDVDFDITGRFSSNIDTSGTKNFCLFLFASGRLIENCSFSGDFSIEKVGTGGHRAITSNGTTIESVKNCEIVNLKLDGWGSNRIVGNNLRLREVNLTRNLNKGVSSDLPTTNLLSGDWYFDVTRKIYRYFNGDNYKDLIESSYTLNNSEEYILPDVGGVRFLEQNYSHGESTVTIAPSQYSVNGTIYFIKNNRNHGVRLKSVDGVVVQGVTNHNSLIMNNQEEITILVSTGANTWRYFVWKHEVVEGASGTFTDPEGKTVTVENGIITQITEP